MVDCGTVKAVDEKLKDTGNAGGVLKSVTTTVDVIEIQSRGELRNEWFHNHFIAELHTKDARSNTNTFAFLIARVNFSYTRNFFTFIRVATY